jgi:hypothetical protein
LQIIPFPDKKEHLEVKTRELPAIRLFFALCATSFILKREEIIVCIRKTPKNVQKNWYNIFSCMSHIGAYSEF